MNFRLIFAIVFFVVSATAERRVEIRKFGPRGRASQLVSTDRVMVTLTNPVHRRDFRVLNQGRGRFKDVFEIEVDSPYRPEGFIARLMESDSRTGIKRIKRAGLSLVSSARSVPNDKYFSRQWYYGADQGYPLPSVGFPDLPNINHKHGKIYIADSGCPTHVDLRADLFEEKVKFVQDGSPDDTKDYDGHATENTGLLAAETDNVIGVASLGSKFRYGCLQVLGANGRGTILDLINMLDYVVEQHLQRKETDPLAWTLVNLPVGGYGPVPPEFEEAKADAKAAGVLIVAAAGNDGVDLSKVYDWFCSDGASNVIVVASSGFADQPASFLSASVTSKGSWTNYGQTVDVFAPGLGMWTLGRDNTFTPARGTSASVPLVTVTVAWILDLFPGTTPKAIKQRLMNGDPLQAGSVGDEVLSPLQSSRSGIRLNIAKALSESWVPPTTPVVLEARVEGASLSAEVSSSGKGIYGCELLLADAEGGSFVRFGELLPNFTNGVATVRARVEKGKTYRRSFQCFDNGGNASPMAPVEVVAVPISD